MLSTSMVEPLRNWVAVAERRVGAVGYAGAERRQSCTVTTLQDHFEADAAFVDMCMVPPPLAVLRICGECPLLQWPPLLCLPAAPYPL